MDNTMRFVAAFFLFTIGVTPLLAEDCKDISFYSVHEKSFMTKDGTVDAQIISRALVKNWSDNDDLILGIVVKDKSEKLTLDKLHVEHLHKGKPFISKEIDRTESAQFKNYFELDRFNFGFRDKRPYQIKFSFELNSKKCSQSITIGGRH